MFAKLLKHEWKATSRLLGILSLCALSTGLLGGIAIRVITHLESKMVTDSVETLIIVGFAFLIFGLIIALILYAAGTEFYLLYRFYKTRFTDQGYLTFTLPVSNRSIFLSSYVHILIWCGISILTICGAVTLALLIGGVRIPGEAVDEMLYMFELERELSGYILLQYAGAFLGALSGIMIMMASITVGAVIAKKHKILAAIGIYYGQSVLLSMISGMIQVVGTLATIGSYGAIEDLLWITGLSYILQIAWGVGAYFLAMHLINRKLNLP